MLLYFSPVPWDSYPQRPHHLVRHVLESAGDEVVWVDPYPTRLPSPGDVRRVFGRARLVTPRPRGLRVIRPRAIPIEPLLAGRLLTRANRALLWRRFAARLPSLPPGDRWTIGIGRPHSLALAALERLSPATSFYDAMDDFPEFFRGRARRAARETEDAIAARADLLLVSSTALFARFSEHPDKRRLVSNAYDMAALPPVRRRAAGPPVLGYLGTVGAWFDWPLVVALARRLPHARVDIVGPRFVATPRPLPPNIRLFPACPHDEAVRHMQRFSAGLIPFTRNALTAGVDPIKYYGYRAMGLPVLSTAFGEMACRGVADGVWTIDAGPGLEARVGSALDATIGADEIARFRSAHAWPRRFDGVVPLARRAVAAAQD